MPLPQHEIKYRADIDGLRAISVSAVIAFHLKIGLSGGFTGVDVFFVISGFLIGQIVYFDVAKGQFSLSGFYERRARRILPALLVTIAASWFIANRQLYAFEMADFSKSAVASILFAANLYFYWASGYFAPAAETIPLLHLWSLGVEEQFYLLFPPIVVVLGRYSPRTMFAALGVMYLASLIAAQTLISGHPEAAFYLPISRAFEILLGALVAHPLFPRSYSRTACGLSATLGAACLLFSLVAFTRDTPFPGVTAMLPCAGAAMILWSGQSGSTPISRLLAWQPLVYIGKLSYSLYLIHWPVIVFGKLLFPNLSHSLFAVSAISVTFVLATNSFWFIETPLRRGPLTKRHCLSKAAAAMLLIGLLPAWTLAKQKAPASADPTINRILSFNYYNPRTRFLARECFLDPDQAFRDYLIDKCIPPSISTGAMLWGDSHAAHLYYGLRAEMQKAAIPFGMLASSACPPVIDLDVELRPKCKDVNREILTLLLRLKPRFVVLSAAWRMNSDVASRLEATVRQLVQAGIKVTIVTESPAFTNRAPNIAAALLQSGKLPLATEAETNIADMKATDAVLSAHFGTSAEVTLLSPFETFCSEKGCPLLGHDGVPLYFDHSHLTEAGSAIYAKALVAAVLEPTLKR
ncbi:acyltransferase family protein [Bradyrhizobium cosmicum]|uniref:acyltransferase family protein n=1 Tax=Bradyrhizobium cosmicum TaxID=1404864 RepID=UPI0002EDE202|nr:acyltransferase family protein [Bradyrhizobium cosmicum]